MDPVSFIEAALVAGAAASGKDTAGQAVKDAYDGLKSLLGRLFADKPNAQVILDEHEADPETYEKLLKKLLVEVHADQDADLLAAAERVMTLVQPQQVGLGKFTIQNTGTVQGQIIGDSQQITQYFYGDEHTDRVTDSVLKSVVGNIKQEIVPLLQPQPRHLHARLPKRVRVGERLPLQVRVTLSPALEGSTPLRAFSIPPEGADVKLVLECPGFLLHSASIATVHQGFTVF